MALPPSAYAEARARARYHLQLQIDSLPESVNTPGITTIRGTVTRIFRGDRALRPGDTVQFQIGVARAGDDIPCGPTIWADLDRLRSAPVLEAFLSGDPPSLTLERDQFELLSESSERPLMPDDSAQGIESAVLSVISQIGRKLLGSLR